MTTSIININDSNYNEALKKNKTLLVDFYAKWCGPCKMIAPILEQISIDKSINTPVAKVDIDDSPEFSEIMRIKAVPSIFFFKEGNAVAKFSEHITCANLINFIKNNE